MIHKPLGSGRAILAPRGLCRKIVRRPFFQLRALTMVDGQSGASNDQHDTVRRLLCGLPETRSRSNDLDAARHSDHGDLPLVDTADAARQTLRSRRQRRRRIAIAPLIGALVLTLVRPLSAPILSAPSQP